MTYSGWWRCRIKSAKAPWLYFKLPEFRNAQEFRREARFRAQLVLRRQILDCERISITNESIMTRALHVDGMDYFYLNGIAEMPKAPLLEDATV